MASTLPYLLQTSSFKDNGPLGGFLAGMRDSYGLANADRDLVDRDIMTRRQQLVLEEEEANTPLKAIERANKISTAEHEQSEWTSGRKQELMEAERTAKLQEAIARKSDAEVRDMYNQATGLASMGALFEDDDGSDQLASMAKWDRAVEIADKVGIKNFPRQYSPDALKRLRMGAKFAMSTIPHLQKRQLMFLDQSFQAGETDKKIASAEKIAAGHDATSTTNAEIAARARVESGNSWGLERKTIIERLAARLEDRIEKGEPLPLNDVKRYMAHAIDKGQKLALIEKITPRLEADFRMDARKRVAAAKELGLPENTSPTILAEKAAAIIAEGRIQAEQLSKFEGQDIRGEDGKRYTVRDGELVPLGGEKKTEAAPAAKPAAAAPADVSTPPPSSTADMINATAFREDPLVKRTEANLRSPDTNNASLQLKGQEYNKTGGEKNLRQELLNMKKAGKIPQGVTGEKYTDGDVRLLKDGRVAVRKNGAWEPIE